MNALGISNVPAPRRANTWMEYLRRDDTRLRELLQTFGSRGATALLVFAILLLAAIPLVPYVERLLGIGEERAKEATALPESRTTPGVPDAPGFNFTIPTGTTAGVTTTPAIGLGGIGRTLLPALTVAGAAIIIGAITIIVPGRQVPVHLDDPHAHGSISVDDLRLNVSPGPITVTPTMLTQPTNTVDIPHLSFTFPKIPIEDESLKALVEALVSYQHTVTTSEQQQQQVLTLQQQIVKLASENAALRQQAWDTAQQQANTTVLRELGWHREDTHAIKDALDHLTEAQHGILPTYATDQQRANTVNRLNFTWTLNRENRRWLNQVLRPGLVSDNFRTCQTIIDSTTPVGSSTAQQSTPPCVYTSRRQALLVLVPDPVERGAAHIWQFFRHSIGRPTPVGTGAAPTTPNTSSSPTANGTDVSSVSSDDSSAIPE